MNQNEFDDIIHQEKNTSLEFLNQLDDKQIILNGYEKLKSTMEDLILIEDDQIIIKAYKKLKEASDELTQISRKINAAKEYCLADSLSVNNISFDKEVVQCSEYFLEAANRIDEFADLLISVVDKDKLMLYNSPDYGSNISFTDVPSMVNVNSGLMSAENNQSNSFDQPVVQSNNKPDVQTTNNSKTSDSHTSVSNSTKTTAPTGPDDLNTSQVGPNGETPPTAPTQPTAPTGPNDQNATQTGPNGEKPPSPPSPPSR